MNVSLRWLRDLAPDLADLTANDLAERLTGLGFPVEGIEDLSAGLEDIVVARVLEVRPHPNADRLRVCRVDGGHGEVQVVCGAPNVEPGGWYPLAPVGATLPGGLQIRKAKLRGEVSEGMLCSEVELGLGKGKDGLMPLGFAEGDPRARPGLSLITALGIDDVRLDVEVTSNRPDLLSHLGIARELSARGQAGLALPPIPGPATSPVPEAGGSASENGWRAALADGIQRLEAPGGGRVTLASPDRCPRYLGLVLRGVSVGPSPAWLQDRLRVAGARPINNVVDATNLVLLELGQPLHAFDLDRLAEGRVVIRRARTGETIRTLDGVQRTLTSEMLAICDAREPVAVAGVMGGSHAEVSTSTRDVLLECALFTPGPIRATRKALGLSTDASYRFERGVDPEGLVDALLRCVEVILATAGGRVEAPILDVAADRPDPLVVKLRPRSVERLLGVPFAPDQIRSLLTPLGFEVPGPGSDRAEGREELPVRIPGWRRWDVTREVDLIEEIARRHGYDRFPDTLGPYRPGTVPDDPRFLLEDRVRDLLVARGFLEAQTPAFAPAGEGSVALQNPISAEERVLRGSLLPALLRRVNYNLARGNREVRLFEIGTVFGAPPHPSALPHEEMRLALVLHGHREPTHWSGPGRPLDPWDLKGLMEELSRVLSPSGMLLVQPRAARETAAASRLAEGPSTDASRPIEPLAGAVSGARIAPMIDPGRPDLFQGPSFEVLQKPTEEAGAPVLVGQGGAVSRDHLDVPPWAATVWGVELTLPAAPEPRPTPRFRSLPTHPAVERDLALLVAEGRAASEVVALIRNEGGALLQEVGIFDVYAGKGVPAGLRSVAVRLRFQAQDRSLTDVEVDAAIRHVLAALDAGLGVRVRGG